MLYPAVAATSNNITVECPVALGNTFADLTDFGKINLTVNSVTGVGACDKTITIGKSAATTVRVDPAPELIVAAGQEEVGVCAADKTVTLYFGYGPALHMDESSLDITATPQTTAGAPVDGITCDDTASECCSGSLSLTAVELWLRGGTARCLRMCLLQYP